MQTAHAQTSLPAVVDLTIEAKESHKTQLPILVLFMSQTCAYCKQALKEFLLPMHRNHDYDGKVLLRQIDIGSDNKIVGFDGKKVSQHNFAKIHGVIAVPTVLLFDEQGNELAKITGLMGVDFYQAYLDNAINESLERIRSKSNLHR